MWTQLAAAMLPTVTGAGAWFAARREPAKLIRVEAMIQELMRWNVNHEMHHVRMEGDSR